MSTLILFGINFIVGFITLFVLTKLFSNDVTVKELLLTVVIIEIVGVLLVVIFGTFGSLLSMIAALLALIFLCRFEGGPAFVVSILYTILKIGVFLLLSKILG